MTSFFPDAISSWDVLITHFTNRPSINNLKFHLLSLFRPKERGGGVPPHPLDTTPLLKTLIRKPLMLKKLSGSRQLEIILSYNNGKGKSCTYVQDFLKLKI